MKNFFNRLSYLLMFLLAMACYTVDAQIGLETEDGLKVGNTTTTTDGAIRFTGSDFEGYFSSMWHSLTGGGGAGVWSTMGSDIYYNAGNVGIGFSSPDELLHVGGTTKIELNSTNGSPHLLLLEDDNSSGGSTRIEFNHQDNAIDRFELRSFLSTGSDHRIGWYFNNNERVVYNEDLGGLGIGTDEPEATLDVIGEGQFTTDADGTTPTLQLVETEDNDFARLFFKNTNNPALRWALSASLGTVDDHRMGWFYDGLPRVIYNEDDGGLGIGTTNPSSVLDVHFSGANGVTLNGDGTGDARITMNNDNGNHFIFDDMDDGNDLKVESANGFSINTNGPNERFNIRSNGEIGINTAASANYRVFIDSNNDLINLFSRADGTGNREAIYGTAISAGAQLKRGVRGNVSGTGGTGTSQGVYGQASTTPTNFWAVYADGDLWYTGSLKAPSDSRLKKDIKALPTVLDKVMQLETVTYEFDKERYPYVNLASGEQVGFVAQNVQELFPTLVEEEKHTFETSFDVESGEATYQELDILGMSHVEMIPILTKAIQEQQTIINELVGEIEKLKADK